MRYQASCHCGQNRLSFEGDINEVLACNCSMCQRRGSLLWFTPREGLQLQTPEDASRPQPAGRADGGHQRALRGRHRPGRHSRAPL